MTLGILDWIFYISLATLAIPIFVLLLQFNRLTPEYRWLTVVLLFSLTADVVAEVLYRCRISTNLASNSYTVVSPAIFTLFIYYCVRWKRIIPFLIATTGLQLVFSIWNIVFIQKMELNSYTSVIEKLNIMVLCIIYYYKLLKELPSKNIETIGMFWIITAFFFTHSAKLVVFSFSTYLIKTYQDNMMVLLAVHNMFSILANVLVAYGVWLNFRQEQHRQSHLL